MEKGMIHLYYGDGKGKTTAAVGLAVRAAGAGKSVVFAQFMKGGRTGELNSLRQLSGVQILRCMKQFPFYKQMTVEEKKKQTELHNQILQEIIQGFQEDKFDLIILDEITYPYQWEMIDRKALREFLLSAKGKAEVVCTGGRPDAFFMECADYITEMKCVRHPYQKGIQAREGVEF